MRYYTIPKKETRNFWHKITWKDGVPTGGMGMREGIEKIERAKLPSGWKKVKETELYIEAERKLTEKERDKIRSKYEQEKERVRARSKLISDLAGKKIVQIEHGEDLILTLDSGEKLEIAPDSDGYNQSCLISGKTHIEIP